MIQSSQNKSALLVGNGVNLLDENQSVSWKYLLKDLNATYYINADLSNVFKPFL